jgi:hypothetical protein
MAEMLIFINRPVARLIVAGSLVFTFAAPAVADAIKPEIFKMTEVDDLPLKAFLATSSAATDTIVNTVTGDEVSIVLPAPAPETTDLV